MHLTPTLETSLRLTDALFARRNDKGGEPIARHYHRVLAYLAIDPPHDTSSRGLHYHAIEVYMTKTVAVLHDVLEDTPLTAEDLLALGYHRDIVADIVTLTIREGESYTTYLDRLIATGSIRVLRTKLADNADNTCPARMALLADYDAQRFAQRYAGVRERLLKRLAELTGKPACKGGYSQCVRDTNNDGDCLTCSKLGTVSDHPSPGELCGGER